jgi:hypothetical protein
LTTINGREVISSDILGQLSAPRTVGRPNGSMVLHLLRDGKKVVAAILE